MRVLHDQETKGSRGTTSQAGVTRQPRHVAAQAFEAGSPGGVVAVSATVPSRPIPLQVLHEGTTGESFFIRYDADAVAQDGKVQNWVIWVSPGRIKRLVSTNLSTVAKTRYMKA